MKRLILWPVGLVTSALVGLLCYGFVAKVPDNAALAMVDLVLFTIIYVLVNYGMLMEMRQQRLDTSIMRREDRELCFKRRKLDWIVNWAREVRKELLIPRLLQSDIVDRHNLKGALQSYAVENEEIIMTAKNFGEEFEGIVEKAAKDLWAYIEALKKPSHTTIDHNSYITGLNQSFGETLGSALKAEDDLVKTSIT